MNLIMDNFKEFYIKERRSNFLDDFNTGLNTSRAVRYGKKVANLVKLANPFSKEGALGRINTGLGKLERHVKAGEPLRTPRPSKTLGSEVADAKSTVERDRAISKFRQDNIYTPNKDNDISLNNAVAIALNSQFPITAKQQQKMGMGSEIINRRKEIKTAAHLANIVLDILVSKIKKSIPYDQALQQAKAEVNNPQVVAELERGGVLPIK